MAELVKWSGRGGIAFFIRSNSVRGVRDLNISVSAETDSSTGDGETYTTRKNSGGYQIGMTAILNEMLDDGIQSTALNITEAARCADTGYFYTGGAKLFPAKFMMTDAKITNISMNPAGAWISCEVQMTLKQCSKFDGSTASAPSGGGGVSKTSSSSKTSAKKASSKNSSLKTIKSSATAIGNTVKSVVKGVTNFLSAAQKQSAKVLKDSKTKKTGGGTTSKGGSSLNKKVRICVK